MRGDYGLTPAEERVVKLVACGFSNEDVALRLGVTSGTVRNHLLSMYAKLFLSNRTQVALWALRTGLVDLEEACAAIGTERVVGSNPMPAQDIRLVSGPAGRRWLGLVLAEITDMVDDGGRPHCCHIEGVSE